MKGRAKVQGFGRWGHRQGEESLRRLCSDNAGVVKSVVTKLYPGGGVKFSLDVIFEIEDGACLGVAGVAEWRMGDILAQAFRDCKLNKKEYSEL